jgi:C1q domain
MRWALRLGIPIGLILVGGAVAWAAGLVVWSDGQVLKAEDLNGNLNYVEGQIAGDGGLQTRITQLEGEAHPASAFRATRTSQLSVASVETQVAFDNVLFGLASEYDVAKGVFSPKSAGIYLVKCGFIYTAAATNTTFTAALFNNGVGLDGTDLQSSVSGQNLVTGVTTIAKLSAGDSVTCSTLQQTGVSQSLVVHTGSDDRNTFSAVRLY